MPQFSAEGIKRVAAATQQVENTSQINAKGTARLYTPSRYIETRNGTTAIPGKGAVLALSDYVPGTFLYTVDRPSEAGVKTVAIGLASVAASGQGAAVIPYGELDIAVDTNGLVALDTLETTVDEFYLSKNADGEGMFIYLGEAPVQPPWVSGDIKLCKCILNISSTSGGGGYTPGPDWPTGGDHIYAHPCSGCDICDSFDLPMDSNLASANWDTGGTPGWTHDGLGHIHIAYGDGVDDARAVHETATGGDNHWVELRDVLIADDAGGEVWLYARMTDADADGSAQVISQNSYMGVVKRSGATSAYAYIYKRVSGSTTQLASVALTSGWFGTSQDLLLQVTGDEIEFRDISGDIELDATDTSISSGEYVGMSGTARADELRVGNFCAGDEAPPCQWTGDGFEPDASYTCTASDDFAGSAEDPWSDSAWEIFQNETSGGSGAANAGWALDGSGNLRWKDGSYLPTSLQRAHAVHKTSMGSADHWVAITGRGGTSSGGASVVLLRVTSASNTSGQHYPDGDFYWLAPYTSGNGRLYKRVGGSWTQLAYTTATAGADILAQASGTTISMKDSAGTFSMSTTDSSISSGNYTAFCPYKQAGSGYRHIGNFCAGTGTVPPGFGGPPVDGNFGDNWTIGGDPGMTIEDNKAVVEYDDGDDTGIAVNGASCGGPDHWVELHNVDIESPSGENSAGYRDATCNLWVRLQESGINESAKDTLNSDGYRLRVIDYGSSSYGTSGAYLTRHNQGGIITLLAQDTSADVGTVKNWFLRADGQTITAMDSEGDVSIEVYDTGLDLGDYVGFELRRRGTDSGTTEVGNMCAGLGGRVPARYL